MYPAGAWCHLPCRDGDNNRRCHGSVANAVRVGWAADNNRRVATTPTPAHALMPWLFPMQITTEDGPVAIAVMVEWAGDSNRRVKGDYNWCVKGNGLGITTDSQARLHCWDGVDAFRAGSGASTCTGFPAPPLGYPGRLEAVVDRYLRAELDWDNYRDNLLALKLVQLIDWNEPGTSPIRLQALGSAGNLSGRPSTVLEQRDSGLRQLLRQLWARKTMFPTLLEARLHENLIFGALSAIFPLSRRVMTLVSTPVDLPDNSQSTKSNCLNTPCSVPSSGRRVGRYAPWSPSPHVGPWFNDVVASAFSDFAVLVSAASPR